MLSERLSLPGLGCSILATVSELKLCHQGIYSVCVCAHAREPACTYVVFVLLSGIIFMIPPKNNAQHRIVVTRNGYYYCCLVMFCGRWFSLMLFWLIGGTFIFMELHLYGEQHISVVHYCVVSIIYHWYATVWLASYIIGTLLCS